MTLRLKLHLIVAGLTLFFLAGVAALLVYNMRASVNEEVVAANRVAAQLLNRMSWVHAAQGTPAMLDFLEGLGRVRSAEVTLLDRDGRKLYTSPPSPYKAGRDAPQWFARLLSPAPSTQSIDFPDGRLVIQANASRAVLDAWDDMRWIVGLALLAFVVVNLILFALVGRAVRPLGQIAQALQSVRAGRLDVRLGRLRGREAAAIGEAFDRMVDELGRQRELEQRAARAETELSDSRALARWVDRRIEEERRLIARELHDEFAQSVTAIRSMASSIAHRTADDPDSAQAARTIADEASRLYEAMHGMIPRLAPLVLDRLGLSEALSDLVERTRRNHAGLEIDLEMSAGDTPVSPDAALTAYRAAQEGITNALRHGDASVLHLCVRDAGASLQLEVTDNGKGLPSEGTSRPGHYGLRWLRERVQALDGNLEIRSLSPRGTSLRVEIPLMTESAT